MDEEIRTSKTKGSSAGLGGGRGLMLEEILGRQLLHWEKSTTEHLTIIKQFKIKTNPYFFLKAF